MKDGTASRTARSVAAHRLEYARVAAGYGDPAADEALTADVADGRPPDHNRMHEYLRRRTAFFDRAVIGSIDSGLRQVVIGGAGYDGRALRYAKPGVRWFEVDHPATQADKRERLARLAIDTRSIRFIPADFTTDPIAEPLIAAGLDAARPALFLLEGVAVYLDPLVVARVLSEFRAVAAGGSLLAISVSVASSTSETRARFRERVAAHGEPARSELSHDEARDLLAAAGWDLRDASERQRALGLLLADAAPGT
jgi:methyltransferase (TIGR00027 family)